MTASRETARSVPLLFFVTGGAGFLLSVLTRPAWQASVESAQVLSGLVTYPAGNSFHMYHVKVWTVLNQLAALALTLGVSERTLSLLIGGLVAALSYAAVALCAFAVSENIYWGMAAPALIDFTRATNVLAVNYPIDFMGTPHTYGAAGLAWFVLTLALLALERYSIAGLALGLAPAIHPSLGVWLWLIAGLTLVWNGRRSFEALRGMWKTGSLGIAVSAASALLQWMWMRPVLPKVDAETAARFVSGWVNFFDYHRRPVDLAVPGVNLSLAAIAAGVLLLWCLDRTDTSSVRFLLKAAIAAAIVALAGAVISRLPPDRMPALLLAFMPTRLFLVSNLVYMAALVGLLGRYRDTAVRWIAAGLTVCLATRNQTIILYGLILASIALLIVIWRLGSHAKRESTAEAARPARLAAGASIALLTLWGLVNHAATAGVYWGRFTDWTNNPVLEAASKTDGILVIGGSCCIQIQLRTRRPLLVEVNAMDQIPYVPESGPSMNKALKAVYGVDLLAPQEILRSATYAEDLSPVVRPLWERRSEEEWLDLARPFGGMAVLVDPRWKLNLPLFARDEQFALYRVAFQ